MSVVTVPLVVEHWSRPKILVAFTLVHFEIIWSPSIKVVADTLKARALLVNEHCTALPYRQAPLAEMGLTG